MSELRRSKLIVLLTVAMAAAACGSLQESSTLAANSAPDAAFGECARADVVLVGAPHITPKVPRAEAERATANVGTGGRAASTALFGLVTVGTEANQPPTVDRVFVDAERRAVQDRPAWILIHRDLKIPTSGGPERPNPTQKARYITVLASVIDAESGRFLRGWSCAWEFAP